jgi:peptide/nickel transport system permease protein
MKSPLDFLKRLIDPRSRVSQLTPISRPVDGPDLDGPPPSRVRWRDILLNPSLMLGGLIVLVLFFMVLFGPLLAPRNPYIAGQHIVPHYDFDQGEYIDPPLPPSEEYPLGTDRWGNDTLSLLLYGTRNTIIACAFITMVRLLLGMILGGLAGWNEGSTLDRGIMAAIGVVTSVPMLISSMLMIFALDIRRGLPVFIVALSVIGWTEIAQYIRSEFMLLKRAPFIEGARSVGMTGISMAVRQVLPNVLAQVLVITTLEMGAVMMLLGELAFVGVFIGGGTQLGLQADPLSPIELVRVALIPEWGAMLAEGFRYLRIRPFVVTPPAVAFFVSVVGFNTLGEGLRQLFEKSGIHTAFLLRKRMLVIVGALTAATIFIISRTGATPWFSEVASDFNGQFAYEHLERLVEMDGRGMGQEGGQRAASYIAEQFAGYGLDPGWKRDSYIYTRPIVIIRPQTQPIFETLDQDGSISQQFAHQLDFGYMTVDHAGNGEVTAPLTFLRINRSNPPNREQMNGLDFRGQIVVAFESQVQPWFTTEALIRGAEGVILITDSQDDDITSQITLPAEGVDYLRSPTLPVIRIGPDTAERMLEGSDNSLSDVIQRLDDGLSDEQRWSTLELELQAHLSIDLNEPDLTEAQTVLGYMEGTDYNLSVGIVVILATYDNLGIDPDGTVYPGANNNASGVAVMLELARLWQERQLSPRRSVLFVAWGGATTSPAEITDFLNDQFNFRHLDIANLQRNPTPELLIILNSVGAGGDSLVIYPESARSPVDILMENAEESEIPIRFQHSIELPARPLTSFNIPWAMIQWEGEAPPLNLDVLENIEEEKLQTVGELLALVITTIVRETTY